MGYAAAQAYIEKIVKESIKESDVKTKTIRKGMDLKITILDISEQTFISNNNKSTDKLSPEDLAYQYHLFMQVLLNHLGSTKRAFNSLKEASSILTKEGILKAQCILVAEGSNISLIGNTSMDIRKVLTTVANHPSLVDTTYGTSRKFESIDPETGEMLVVSSKRTSILELGHTGLRTPLIAKLNAVIKSSNDSTLKNSLKGIVNEIRKVQASLNYTFLNTSNNELLGSASIRMVIQPRDVNAQFSVDEKKLYAQAVRAVQYSLKLENVPGSNTLIEDAIQFTKDRVLETFTSKKHSNVKKHSPVKGKVVLPDIKSKITASSPNFTMPGAPLRNKQGSFYSLISLQNLINTHLQSVISANMGNGNDPRILNYQTGRFAASVNVERMSQSREGMITAFYNYMKNPYQTFEPGYRQGSPKTRDPKLLIATSIREIAATKVGNRLRAVSI